MGIFTKKHDKEGGGGLFSKLNTNRRASDARTNDHIVLRLTETQAGLGLQVSAHGGLPMPDFEVPHDYAAWHRKEFATDADKEASKRCWAALKYTRVLDIIGVASPSPGATRGEPTAARRAPQAAAGEDRLAEAELADALSPAPADLHDAPRPIDKGDTLVQQLLWFCDALQHLAVVRYLGAPPAEAFVRLFTDVDRKILFPAPPTDAAAPPLDPVPPEVSPGASTRVVSNVAYTPATGPNRVPLTYDYPTAQEMTYLYLFPESPAGPESATLGLEATPWRRLIREVAGILTYFQDMAPDVQFVNFPLTEADRSLQTAIAEGERIVDGAEGEGRGRGRERGPVATETERQHAALAADAATQVAGVSSIEGTLAAEERAETTPVNEMAAISLATSTPDAPVVPVPPTKNSRARAPSAPSTTHVPATRSAFLAAIAHRLTLLTNDPDHLLEMVGTGSPEGQVQDALSHIAFLSAEEYARQASPQVEYDLETRV